MGERDEEKKRRLFLTNFGSRGEAEARDLTVDLFDGGRKGEGEGEVVSEGVGRLVLYIGCKVDLIECPLEGERAAEREDPLA